MKHKKVMMALLLVFMLETVCVIYLMKKCTTQEADAVLVNEAVMSVQKDFDNIGDRKSVV